jgi:hypothetical protein
MAESMSGFLRVASACNVGVIGPDDHPPPAVGDAIRCVVDVSELGVCRKVEACCGLRAEDLEPQTVGMAERDTGDGEGASGTVGKLCDKRGDVLVGDRPALIAHGSSGGVAQRGADGHRPVLDQDRQRCSIDSDDRAAELLAHVEKMTAEIGERPRTEWTLVAPACRRVRVGGVVAPIPAAEVHDLAECSGLDLLTDGGNGRERR